MVPDIAGYLRIQINWAEKISERNGFDGGQIAAGVQARRYHLSCESMHPALTPAGELVLPLSVVLRMSKTSLKRWVGLCLLQKPSTKHYKVRHAAHDKVHTSCSWV